MPDVAVTLVLYNSDDHVRACAAALRPEVEAGTADILAVDNASPDASATILQRELPSARVIRSEVNRGFAGGCNLAWPHVDARYWLLLNPDVTLDRGTITALARWMDAHPEVGVASPWLRNGDGAAPAYPGRALPSVTKAVLELLRLHKLLPRRARSALLQGSYAEGRVGNRVARRPGWVPGAAMIARTEAVREVGPLKEDFFLYGEDLEWCWRMRRRGWEVAASPDGGGTHHSSASSRRTWGDEAVEERIAAGTLHACREIRGPFHARAFASVTALALALESWHPRRKAEERARYAAVRRAWWKALRAL